MSELDAARPEQIERLVSQLGQWAYVAGEYYRALINSGLPPDLAADLIREWSEKVDELEDDDDA